MTDQTTIERRSILKKLPVGILAISGCSNSTNSTDVPTSTPTPTDEPLPSAEEAVAMLDHEVVLNGTDLEIYVTVENTSDIERITATVTCRIYRDDFRVAQVSEFASDLNSGIRTEVVISFFALDFTDLRGLTDYEIEISYRRSDDSYIREFDIPELDVPGE